MKHKFRNSYRINLECEFFRYVFECLKGEKDEGQVPNILGDLAFNYAFMSFNENSIYKFIERLILIHPFLNDYLILHVSNFCEIVLVYYPKLITPYIDLLKTISNKDIHKCSLLYKSIVLSALRHNYDIEDIINNIPYKWCCYYEISNYYLYLNDFDKAMKYIIEAIRTCPNEVKNKYVSKQKFIAANYSF